MKETLQQSHRQWLAVSLALLATLLLGGCTQRTPTMLQPQSESAAQIEGLWWLLFGLGTLVYLLVMGLMIFALFRRRFQSEPAMGEANGRKLIWLGGIILPALILTVTYGFTLNVMRNLGITANDPLVVEVTGHQWWWEVSYPEQHVVTANEIYIPTGEAVRFQLTSADVIHSFWVPELHGKMDLIPGITNTWELHADAPGDYWGLCAEFCGTQHAKMLFLVVAVPPEQFASWLEAQSQPAVTPATEAAQTGKTIFMETGCGQCHAVRGTDAAGDLGPDLTHLASRLTLGAGSVSNNRGNLAGWVADPHGIKPGSLMPTSGLSGPELQSLIAYLESLE